MAVAVVVVVVVVVLARKGRRVVAQTKSYGTNPIKCRQSAINNNVNAFRGVCRVTCMVFVWALCFEVLRLLRTFASLLPLFCMAAR